MTPPPADLIQIDRLNHFFGDGDSRCQILFNNSLTIPPGQMVIMTGPSGSGKTTLLTLMGALRAPQDGEISVLGQSLRTLKTDGLTVLRRQIGFIFQMHNLLDSLTALDNVLMSTHLLAPANEPGHAQNVGQQAADLLNRLGLGHRLHHRPAALSGGQRQRVAVARALVGRPRLILADEPTAALDKASSMEVVELLHERTRQDGCSVIMVTHDNRIIDRADRILSMVDGRIVSDVAVNEMVALCGLLRQVDLFSRLSTAEISTVAEKMRVRPVTDGEMLIRQGDMGEEFFVLAEGRARIMVDGAPVAELETGRYFGERALITGETRNASVYAVGSGKCYILDKTGFHNALNVVPSYAEQLKAHYFNR